MNVIRRQFSTSIRLLGHENPLGLARPSPQSSKLNVRKRINGVKKIVVVASGKGGVGKSTVATNLAILLKDLGYKTGILDTDLFGPSIPKLLNLQGVPRVTENEGRLLPLSNYGLKLMSMGFLIPSESNAVVWRGLMVTKVLQQLLFDVEWGDLDILVVDTPPGTGDTQLTLSQQLKIDGAVIVSTPQDIALIDLKKGVTMFNKVQIPILGLVQNMSYYHCPNCHHESHIFAGAKEGVNGIENTELLGQIPLNEVICSQSDKGTPVTVSHAESPIAAPYVDILKKVLEKLKIGG